jgi:hypothetical protein
MENRAICTHVLSRYRDVPRGGKEVCRGAAPWAIMAWIFAAVLDACRRVGATSQLLAASTRFSRGSPCSMEVFESGSSNLDIYSSDLDLYGISPICLEAKISLLV